MALSLGVVYSASSSWSIKIGGDEMYLFKNHLVRVAAGVFFIFLFSKVEYTKIIPWRKFLMLVVIFMLMYLLIAGSVEEKKGAARWIRIAGFSFQPADFVKYVLVLNISYMLAKKKDYITSLYYSYLPMLFYVILVVILIALQPNISTAIMIFTLSLLIFYIGNVRLKHIFYTVLSVLPAAFLYILNKSYAVKRLSNYLNNETLEDSKYQLSQAIIGFGSGFIFGVGPGNSHQKEFYLPQSYDDFIFAIVGEEYGFLGTMLIITLFGLFIYRGLKISKQIENDFGKYLSFGITVSIGLNAIVNMMVATGIIPTTGVTLPFISYGGTSTVVNSIAVGILLNISAHRERTIPSWADSFEESGDV